MILVPIPVSAIMVTQRQRPVDDSKVRDIARSIEQQGLLQPIGVQETGDAETYLLVYGAHRLAALKTIGQDTIDAYLLPREWDDDACLLAELQENCARNDLTGAQRKAYAAEIGRLSAKIAEKCDSATRTDNWILKLAQDTNTPRRTVYDWWQSFCHTTALVLTPKQALDVNKQQFYDWLEEQQRQAEETKARKRAEEMAQKKTADLEEARAYLEDLRIEYGEETVWNACVIPVFPGATLA